MDPKLKKIILSFAGGTLLILAIVFIYRYFTTGYIDITTDKAGYTIVIQRTTPSVKTDTITMTGSHYKGAYSTGEYSVRISDTSASSGLAAKTFKLAFSKTQKVSLYTTKIDYSVSNFTPVSSLGSTAMSYSGNMLKFLNINDQLYGDIISIDRNNHLTTTEATGGYPSYFKKVDWNMDGQGVAVGGDGLYRLDSSDAKPQKVKNTPVAFNKITKTNISSNGDIYIGDGKNIYRQASGSDSFTKILSNDVSAQILSASSDNVLALTGIEQERTLKIVLINLKTNEQKTMSGDVYSGHFSPDGKKILLSGNGKTTGIYSTSDLKLINATPRKDSAVLAWYDNDNIVYSDSHSLWRYNLNEKASYIIANLANTQATLNNVTVTKDKDTIFVNTMLSVRQINYFKTYKYSIKDPIPKVSSELSVVNTIFPYNEQNCYFDYVALNPNTKINIITTGTPSKISVCKVILKNYLTRYNIDQSKLNFQDIVTAQPAIKW